MIGRKGSFGAVNWSPKPVFAIDTTYYVDPTLTSANMRWLYYALLNARLDSVTRDTGVPGLNREIAYQSRIAFPPADLQIAIADFLDRETEQIDRLMEKKRRLIELLEEKRTALISHAVTKGLDPTVPIKDSGIPWLGDIPAHWQVVRLRYLAEVQTGITLGRRYEPARQLISRPYLRVANVQSGYLELTEVTTIDLPPDEANRYELESGDVLMTEGGDIDKLGRGVVWAGEIEGCLHQNHVFAVRPGQRLRSKFLMHLLGITHGRTYFELTAKKTTNLASTNTTQLKGFPVILPNTEEQQVLIDAIDTWTSSIDGAARKLAKQLDLLAEYRQALITAAVTGQIDVTERSPDPEEAIA